MKTFEWTNDFNTGQPVVDQQHRRLVDLINELGQALGDHEANQAQLQSVFAELADYARKHFEDEEQLMTDSGIDVRHIDRHRMIHANFLNDVAAIYEAGKQNVDQCGADMMDYLTHWLTFHILGQDQDMSHQIDAVEAGMPPAEAFEHYERPKNEAMEPLLSALNRMLRQLSERNQELVELNETLEARVAERTEELSKANEELKALSLTDVLTGLSNRRHAMKLLETLWNESHEQGIPISALMIDADNFKQVNDNYGHDAGDDVLVELSRALKNTVRTDDLVFRLGGDEFLVLCPATDFAGAMKVADSLLDHIAQLRVATGDGFWKSSISIGVATSEAAMRRFDELIKIADDSLYMAKDAGRGCARSSQAKSTSRQFI